MASVKSSIDIMCYSPLKIQNNAKSGFRDMAFYKYVPCGSCEECLSQYKNEWYFRAYYQHLYTTKVLHGATAFVTLTYNDNHIPHYKDGTYHTVCFDKWDIQRFIKYLRRFFTKYNTKYNKAPLWSIDKAKTINYIICSEFGKDPTATHRPHYHGLIFLPEEVPTTHLSKALQWSWSLTVKYIGKDGKKHIKREPLGFISYGKYGSYVTNECALKYAMKYVGKDVNGYEDFHGIQEYIEAHEDNYDKIKRYLPFHLQGRYFGIYALECLTREDFICRKVIDPLPNPTDPTKHQYIPIPSYIRHHYYFSKPDGAFPNYGYFVHKDNYYEDISDQLTYDINQQVNALTTLFSGENLAKELQFSSKSDLSKVLSMYKQIDIKDYAYFTKLLNFGIPSHFCNTLHDTVVKLITEQARVNDKLVREVNLNDSVIYEIEYNKEVRTYYEQDPLTIEGQPDFLKTDYFAYVPHLTIVGYKDGYQPPSSGSFLQNYPHERNRVYLNSLWKDYYPELWEFHQLLTDMKNTNKNRNAVSRKAQYMKQKEARDYHNSRVYHNQYINLNP